jgi:ABC-type Na+ transport system ATPase subunit NatA
VIEVTGITKRYGDTLAVHDLTFEVRPGQINNS